MGRSTPVRRRPSRIVSPPLAQSRTRGRPSRLVSLAAAMLVVAACTSSVSPTEAPSSASTAVPTAGAASSPSAVAGALQATPSAGPSIPASRIPAITARPSTAPPTRPPRTPAPTPRPTVQPTRTPTPTVSHLLATIVDFGFRPASLSVARGTVVTWRNSGQAQHTVTSNTGAFASAALSTGASFSFTFRIAGTYAYHCAIHPFMTATIVVR